ncbi:hypothetical protein H6F43_04745 [Leptolyngbya sp. FACHB-36]|uniref:hypothetical protein n=1 Tax=Leptolyngbya sp. FACHB-36 TaxID=2692808 RepID=UPI0016813BDF|nr:hypothetical protein [Leptolyngbya sp. FACHB-36]
MSIVVTLSPELEALLRDKVDRQGQDINPVASELLINVLRWEQQDSKEATKEIQQGLDNFEANRFRSFQDFAKEQRRKYNFSEELNAT